MLGDIYRKNGEWRFSAVGQGFNGGLSALLKHFGGEEEIAISPLEKKVIVPQVITLTKKNESHKLSLLKGIDAPKNILVSATWVDNGDGNAGNDDLDLRVGILLPDGSMKIIQAPDKVGSFSSSPYVFHTGDVTTASIEKPGVETVQINPEISKLLGGRIALVFSVYSAISNGMVSVASLKPKMRMEYGTQIVECSFEFKSFFGSSCVYTYVIGIIEIDQGNVTLRPSGETSSFMSEATPWLQWNGDEIKLTMDGPPVFKGKPIKSWGKKTYS
jgi:tellurite resistance protein TerA